MLELDGSELVASESLRSQLELIKRVVLDDQTMSSRCSRGVWDLLLKLGVNRSILTDYAACLSGDFRKVFDLETCQSLLHQAHQNDTNLAELAQSIYSEHKEALEIFVFHCFYCAHANSMADINVAGGTGRLRSFGQPLTHAGHQEWKEHVLESPQQRQREHPGVDDPDVHQAHLAKLEAQRENNKVATHFNESQNTTQGVVDIIVERHERTDIIGASNSQPYIDQIVKDIQVIKHDRFLPVSLEHMLQISYALSDGSIDKYVRTCREIGNRLFFVKDTVETFKTLTTNLINDKRELELEFQRHQVLANHLRSLGLDTTTLWSSHPDVGRLLRLSQKIGDLYQKFINSSVYSYIGRGFDKMNILELDVKNQISAAEQVVKVADRLWTDSSDAMKVLGFVEREGFGFLPPTNFIATFQSYGEDCKNVAERLKTELSNIAPAISDLGNFAHQFQSLLTEIDTDAEVLHNFVDRLNIVFENDPAIARRVQEAWNDDNYLIAKSRVNAIQEDVLREADSYIYRFIAWWRSCWFNFF